MNLEQWLDQYFLERSLAKKSQKNLRDCSRMFGSEKQLAEIDELAINRWLVLLAEQYSDSTVKRMRGDILSILNGAADAQLMKRLDPRRIRRCVVRREFPKASTPADIGKLLDACEGLTGRFSCGIPRAPLMRAWILVGWDCCFRPWSDQLAFKLEHIQKEGLVWFVQNKTDYPKAIRLRPETLKAIKAIFPPNREEVFPVSRSAVGRAWEVLCQLSGVRIPPKQLRASRATEEERHNPGGAPRILGHKPGSTVAYKHYVNPMMSLPTPPHGPKIDRRKRA